MAFIKVIQHEEATGQLKDIYDNLVKTRGKLAEVHKIQSLNPQTIVEHMNLYMSIMYGQSPLSRAGREMIGVIVSVTNHCSYCVKHHSDALKFYWKDDQKTDLLASNYRNARLAGKELALCIYAETLTKNDKDTDFEAQNKKLRTAGLTDREILDATLVIAYFNFVNRMVLSLGVEEEADTGGYKY